MSKNLEIPRQYENQRVFSLDAIRAIATICVIIVHTHFLVFSPDSHNVFYSFFAVIGNVGVPMFVMLTGYLMFHRNYEDKEYLQKYLKRNLFPLFVAYEFWLIAQNISRYTGVVPEPQKWTDVLKAALFMGDTAPHLWYLPLALGLYLGLPFFAVAYEKISLLRFKKVFWAVLILSGVLIPTVGILAPYMGYNEDIHPVFRMNVFGAAVWGESVWMVYLLAGHSIYKGKLKTLSASFLIILGIILPLAVMVAFEYTGHKIYGNHHSFILLVLLSISMFEILTRTERIFSGNSYRRYLVLKISSVSFAIYMTHIFFGLAIFHLWESYNLPLPMGRMFNSLTALLFYGGYLAIILLITVILAVCLKRINFVKKYVFLMK